MKEKYRFFAVFIIISIVLAVSCFALVPDIYPDDVTGEYTYTYTGEPNGSYSVFVVAGADAQTLGLSSEFEILYYGRFAANADGEAEIRFVPKFYKDATMFVVPENAGAPQKVCNVLVGDEVLNVARIRLSISKDEFVSNGIDDMNLKYTVNTYDSFGFESIPEQPLDFEIETESGDPVEGFHLVNYEMETITILADIH